MTICHFARRCVDGTLAAAKAAARCLVAYLALQSIGRARAHGYLADPAARNVQHNSDYCPHCLNAGGPWTVYARGQPGKHGVCGDAWNAPRRHEEGGVFATPPRIAKTYSSGGTLAARVTLTANHKGRWSLRLCPTPRRATSQSCFDKHLLKRADGKGAFTPVPGGTSAFRVKYRLPPGVKCARCVLQWTYETGNSCNPPGMPRPTPGLESCRTSLNGEQFWNCADIRIA